MGGSHFSKVPKAQSLNLEEDPSSPLLNNYRKLTESSSMSPARKKIKVLDKIDLQLEVKKQ